MPWGRNPQGTKERSLWRRPFPLLCVEYNTTQESKCQLCACRHRVTSRLEAAFLLSETGACKPGKGVVYSMETWGASLRFAIEEAGGPARAVSVRSAAIACRRHVGR